MIFTVVPVHNEVEAKPKKGSVVTINKKQYIYQGTVKNIILQNIVNWLISMLRIPSLLQI